MEILMKNVMKVYLGYSTKRKDYKCLKYNTKKIVESANVRVVEFEGRGGTSCNEEPKDHCTFIYLDDDAPSTQ